MTKPKGTFHDAITGETIERELTDEEIAALPEPSDLPSAEELLRPFKNKLRTHQKQSTRNHRHSRANRRRPLWLEKSSQTKKSKHASFCS